MRSGGVRLVRPLGRAGPDRLSTAMVWSLMAHFGLLAGMLVVRLLPSEPSTMGEPHFVTLAAPGAPAAGGGGGGPEPESPKPRTTPPPPPEASTKPPEPPAPAPTRASVPSDKPPKPPPPARAHEPAPAPSHERLEEPASDEASPGAGGTGKPGAAPGPAGPATGAEAGGVGGTSFGEGDFRFGWYQSAIESKLQAAWRRPMASGTETQTATVSFVILRNGAVKDVQIVTPSGNSALDLSTMRAVYDATPLPPLPRGWSGDSVHVSIEFSLKPVAP